MSEQRLYFVVRGAPHPFDAPDHPAVQIIAWRYAESAEEAATEVAEADGQHDYYSAYLLGGGEGKLVLFVPGEGVDTDPPEVAIG